MNVTITNPFPNDGSAIITLPSDYDISGASVVGNSMGDNTELSIGKNEDSSTHTMLLGWVVILYQEGRYNLDKIFRYS